MLRLYTKIFKTGVLTERLAVGRKHALGEAEGSALSVVEGTEPIEQAGRMLKAIIDQGFHGSLAIRHVDAGSCNGCELEIHAVNNVYYNIERFGMHFVASPRHADILMVTGPVSRHMEAALKRTFEAVANPKWVIAAGDCAACGGEFGTSYASCGAVRNVIPVDAVIPGCPPAPLDLVRGILELFGR